MRRGPRRPGRRRRPPSIAATLAQEWAWLLRAAGLLQRTGPELELLLRSQADLLLRTLYADPFIPQPARGAGRYLVEELQATQPDALQRSFLLLATRLLDGSPLAAEAGRHRLDHILGEFIAGWAEAVHAHTLTAQEEFRRAMDSARHEPKPDPDPDPDDPTNPWFT
jgi:hypothetical protein